MKKQILLGLCTASLMSTCVFADESKVFVKTKIGIGYDAQIYSGEVKDMIKEADDAGLSVNKVNRAPIISLGSNLYFNLSNVFKPFIGFEAQGRLPVFGNDFEDKASWLSVPSLKEKKYSEIQFNEYFRLNAKLGSRINIGKNFAFEPYALGGINFTEMKYNRDLGSEHFYDKSLKYGFTYGLGTDIVIYNRFTIGFEYRCGITRFDGVQQGQAIYMNDIKLKTHSFIFKTGIEF